MKSTDPVYGSGPYIPPSSRPADGGDAVHRELAYVVRAVVERREPAAVEPARVDDPLGRGSVVVDVADDHGGAALDGVAERGQGIGRRGGGGTRGARGLGPVAHPDRGRDRLHLRRLPCRHGARGTATATPPGTAQVRPADPH